MQWRFGKGKRRDKQRASAAIVMELEVVQTVQAFVLFLDGPARPKSEVRMTKSDFRENPSRRIATRGRRNSFIELRVSHFVRPSNSSVGVRCMMLIPSTNSTSLRFQLSPII